MMEELYEEITEIYDCITKNKVRIVIGDLNVKIRRETIYRPTVWLRRAHKQSNDNGKRVVVFATLRNMTISSTLIPHKNIHNSQTYMEITWRKHIETNLPRAYWQMIQIKYFVYEKLSRSGL